MASLCELTALINHCFLLQLANWPNYEEFVKFWRPLHHSSHPTYLGYWLYQLHKHGAYKLFQGDFLQVALQLGKAYILELEKFMAEYGYSKGGMFVCKDFQDNLDKALKFRARAVFGWEENKEQPYILDLIKIEILLDLQRSPIDYDTTQECIKHPSFFMMFIPKLFRGNQRTLVDFQSQL